MKILVAFASNLDLLYITYAKLLTCLFVYDHFSLESSDFHMVQLSRFFREPPHFRSILQASGIGLKSPEFFKKKEKLIRIPQYLIILCNNFSEETRVERGDSHCVSFLHSNDGDTPLRKS